MSEGKSMEQITLYTRYCPMCKVLETKLKEKNISYEIVDDEDKIIEMGFKSVPVLKVDDNIMLMKDALQWVKKYDQHDNT